MIWKCPFARHNQTFRNAIMCDKEMKDGVDYNQNKNFFDVYCPHQRQCNCTKGVVNTEKAKKCYELKRKQLNNRS